MEESCIVIMLKDKATGFLEKELGNYKIGDNENLIANIYAEEDAKGHCTVHMKLSTGRETLEWEFNAIYDHYDDEAISGQLLSFAEIDDCFDPTWEAVFDFFDNEGEMEDKIVGLLALHKKELEDVFEAIRDKQSEYEE